MNGQDPSSITAISPTEGRGTETSVAEQQQRQRKHVFVVNGDPPFLDLMRDLLQDARYNATTTNYVPPTFAQIAALQPDLLVVDLVVGVQAGWDLLDALRDEAITHGIPIIVTSTNQVLLDRACAEQERFGSRRCIVMPFDLDHMLKTIDALIGTAEPD